ncbi:hypothetical protein [Mariniphaga sp.]|uniref:hypothetical protein n=1 Tax=Mariniphaga sp. TaxID=1954475 RepID=UPI0035661C2A
METKEIKQLLQRYFNGESTLAEERLLEKYFQSENVADELKEYEGFFSGISALSETGRDEELEVEIMDFILKNEPDKTTNKRWLWQMVTGIAASIIIVIGGVLFYQHEKEPFKDTFDNPELAYAYAEQTLGYVSEKYNKGLAGLANFDKLETAKEPMQKGVKPVNEYLEKIENMRGGQ